MAATYTDVNVNFNGTLSSCYVIEVIGGISHVIPVSFTDPTMIADINAFDAASGPFPAAGGLNASKSFIVSNGTTFYETYRGTIRAVGSTPQFGSMVDGDTKYWNGTGWVTIV